MKRILSLILSVLMLTLLFTGCGEKAETAQGAGSEAEQAPSSSDSNAEDVGSEDKYTAVIKVKDYGEITVELDSKAAPITVKNFVSLVNAKFYDGLTFHRIIDGFMIQGGDPNGDGTGGSDKKIKGEFSANGVNNTLKHERGVISMARSGSAYEQYLSAGYKLSNLPDEVKKDIQSAFNSASSQFFIMHKTSPHLDGNYAAFGKVTNGMDIVDALATKTPVTDSNGTVSAKNQPVIESITIK